MNDNIGILEKKFSFPSYGKFVFNINFLLMIPSNLILIIIVLTDKVPIPVHFQDNSSSQIWNKVEKLCESQINPTSYE